MQSSIRLTTLQFQVCRALSNSKTMAKRISPQHLEFAARVRAIRTSLGLTQLEFAKRLGKPQSYLSKIESCEKRVDVIEALSICKALGVTLDVLLPGELIRFLIPQHGSARKQSDANKGKHGGHL